MAVPEPIPRAHAALGSLAIVVDSSVALAGNWHTILKYLGLFVQRLILTNHGVGVRRNHQVTKLLFLIYDYSTALRG